MPTFEELNAERLDNLVGKFIIRTTSPRTGNYLYLQDREISDRGYWTYYLSNAIGFVSKRVALQQLSRFSHNEPTLCVVESDGRAVPVSAKEA